MPGRGPGRLARARDNALLPFRHATVHDHLIAEGVRR
eukprot:gene8536-8200_t